MRFKSIYKDLQNGYFLASKNTPEFFPNNKNSFKPFYDESISRNVGFNRLDFSNQQNDTNYARIYPFFFNRDFSFAAMTTAEIDYLNSLIEEYKSPFTTRARRNEIYVALNVAPSNIQIRNSTMDTFIKNDRVSQQDIPQKEKDVGFQIVPGTYRVRITNVKPAVRQPADPGTEVDIVKDFEYSDIIIQEGRLNPDLWGEDPEKRFLRPFVIPSDPTVNSAYTRLFLKRFGYMSPAAFKTILDKNPNNDEIFSSEMGIKTPPIYTNSDGSIVVGNLDPILRSLESLNSNISISGFFWGEPNNSQVNNTNDKITELSTVIGIGSGNVETGFIETPSRIFSFYTPPISDQELVFYIRLKYGIAFTADEEDPYGSRGIIPTLYSIPFVNDEPDVPASIGVSAYNTTITKWIAENSNLDKPLEAGSFQSLGKILPYLRNPSKFYRLLRVFTNRGMRPGSSFLTGGSGKAWWKSKEGLHGKAITNAIYYLLGFSSTTYNILDTYVSWEDRKEFDEIYYEEGDYGSSQREDWKNMSFMRISATHASFDFRKDTGITSGILPNDWETGNRTVPNNLRAPNATQNQSIPFSKLRAFWRANRIIEECEKWAIRVSSDDVLQLSGKSVNKVDNPDNTVSTQLEDTIYFVSGKSAPDGDVYHNRPWTWLFDKNDYDSDRVINSKNQCYNTETQYLRNIVVPMNIWAYIETHEDTELFPEENWLFTSDQIGKTVYALSESIPYKSKLISLFTKNSAGNLPSGLNHVGNKLPEELIVLLKMKSLVSPTEEPLNYKNLWQNTIYNNKDAITIFGLATISIIEFLNQKTHHGKNPINLPFFRNVGHHFYHDAFVIAEAFITGYKVQANMIKGKPANYVFAALNIVGFVIGYLAGRDGGFRVPGIGTMKGHKWAFGFYIGLALIEKLYYGYDDKSKRDELISLLNQATDQGFLEGPYMQSKGKIRIPKTTNGKIPTSVDTDENGNVVRTEGTNIQTQKPSINITRDEIDGDVTKLKQRLVEINSQFLNSGGYGQIDFFNQINKEECRELIRIAGQSKSEESIYSFNSQTRYNEVLNYAPNYFDVFKYDTVSTSVLPSAYVKSKGLAKGLVKSGVSFDNYDKYDQDINMESVWGDFQNTSENNRLLELWKKYLDEYDPMTKNRGSLRYAEYQKLFKYTRSLVDKNTNLSPYLNGEFPPTEPYYRYNRYELTGNRYLVELSNGPILRKYIETPSVYPVKVSDKEKVNLIRRKYGLDQVIPYSIKDGTIDTREGSGNWCCDQPKITVDPLPQCLYVIDFSSEQFIQKLKQSPECDCE